MLQSLSHQIKAIVNDMIINTIDDSSRRLVDLPSFERLHKADKKKEKSIKSARMERLAMSFDALSPVKQLHSKAKDRKKIHASQASLTKVVSQKSKHEKIYSARPRPQAASVPHEPADRKLILTKTDLLKQGFNVMTGKINPASARRKPSDPNHRLSKLDPNAPQTSSRQAAQKEEEPIASHNLTPINFTTQNTPSAHALLGQSQLLKLIRKASEKLNLSKSASTSLRRNSFQLQAALDQVDQTDQTRQAKAEATSTTSSHKMRQQKNSTRIKQSTYSTSQVDESLAFLGDFQSNQQASQRSRSQIESHAFINQPAAYEMLHGLAESQLLDKSECFEILPFSPRTYGSNFPSKQAFDQRLRLNLSTLAGRDAHTELYSDFQSDRMLSTVSAQVRSRSNSKRKPLEGEQVYQSLLSKRSKDHQQSSERISNLSGVGWNTEQPDQPENLYYKKQPMKQLIDTIDELAKKEASVFLAQSRLEDDKRSLLASQPSIDSRSNRYSQSLVRSPLAAKNQLCFDLYAPLTARSSKSSKRTPPERKPISSESKKHSTEDLEIRELCLSGDGKKQTGHLINRFEARSEQQLQMPASSIRKSEASISRKKIEDSPEVYIAEQLERSTPAFKTAQIVASNPIHMPSIHAPDQLNELTVDPAARSLPTQTQNPEEKQTSNPFEIDQPSTTEHLPHQKPSLSLNLKLVKISRGEDLSNPNSQRSHEPDNARFEASNRGHQSDRPFLGKNLPPKKQIGLNSLLTKISRFSNYKKIKDLQSHHPTTSEKFAAVDYEKRKQSLKNFLDTFDQRDSTRRRRDSPSHPRDLLRAALADLELDPACLEPHQLKDSRVSHFGSSGRNPAKIIKNIQYEVINEQDEDCVSETTRRQGSIIEDILSRGISRKASPLRKVEVRSSQKSAKLPKIDADNLGSSSPESFRRSINESPATTSLRFENSARTLVKLDSTTEWSVAGLHPDAGEKPTPRNAATRKLKVMPRLEVDFGDQDPLAGSRDGQTITPRSRRQAITFNNS